MTKNSKSFGNEQNKPNTNSNSSGYEPAILISKDMLADPEKTDIRIDFERGMSYFPFLTLTLIFLNAIVFIWEVSQGVLASKESIINAGALSRPQVLEGELWRLFSAIFMHASFDHLIGNCVILYILGMACEHALGLRNTAKVYLISGLCGSLLSVTMQSGPSVGASGAIFGILGSIILFLYKYHNYFFLRDKRIGSVLGFWALYTIGVGFLTPYVDNFAHIGGFIGGGVITLLVKPKLVEKARRNKW